MTVNISYRVSDPNVGLALSKDMKYFKMFTTDTGLFVTLVFKDKAFTENVIYRKLMGDKLKVNLGSVYENMVAQMLVADGNELFYNTYPTPDGKHNYEIDFLLSKGNKICPIEVKSSGYKTHASMDDFCKKHASRIKDKYIIYTKDVMKEQNLLYLPVYMAGLISGTME